jgi:hypothetical protein
MMNEADRSPCRRDHRTPDRKVAQLLDAFGHVLARRGSHFPPDGRQRFQGRTDGSENALHFCSDQSLPAHFDHILFSSLACRYISEARSRSSFRSNSILSVL